MTADATDSSEWLRKLVAGDEFVVTEFLDAFGPALERVAANRMSPALRRRVGADDVFQSVCRTFFRRAKSGRFRLPDRESLWRLLCAITLNKVRLHARFHAAHKRGALRDAGGEAINDLAGRTASAEISPEEAVEFADQMTHLISSLGDTEGKLLELKMQGHSHQEIADQLQCTERTVGRLLAKLQSRLTELLPSD